ncbi:hypothetical protein D3C80_1782290 [compost metagenome]
MPGLIDGDDLLISQQLHSVIIQPGHIIADIELGRRDCPEGHGCLPLIPRKSVHRTVADIEGIKIIPAPGAGLPPPDRGLREQAGDIGPLGQPDTAVIGLHIPMDPPAVGILLPEVRVVVVKRP